MNVCMRNAYCGWIVLVISLSHLASSFVFEKKWLQSLQTAHDFSSRPLQANGEQAERPPFNGRGKPNDVPLHRNKDIDVTSEGLETISTPNGGGMMRPDDIMVSADSFLESKLPDSTTKKSLPFITKRGNVFSGLMNDRRMVLPGSNGNRPFWHWSHLAPETDQHANRDRIPNAVSFGAGNLSPNLNIPTLSAFSRFLQSRFSELYPTTSRERVRVKSTTPLSRDISSGTSTLDSSASPSTSSYEHHHHHFRLSQVLNHTLDSETGRTFEHHRFHSHNKSGSFERLPDDLRPTSTSSYSAGSSSEDPKTASNVRHNNVTSSFHAVNALVISKTQETHAVTTRAPHATYAAIPKAHTHPKPLVPTLASPTRFSQVQSLGGQFGSLFQNNFLQNFNHLQGISSGSNLLHADVNAQVIKRTTTVRQAPSTPTVGAFHIMASDIFPNLLSSNVLSSNILCLQYLRVDHDLPCSQRRRRDVLTTAHLTSLLQHHGGSASSPYTAPNYQAAVSGFRNLIPLGIPELDEHIHFKFTADQIQKLLDKHHTSKNQSRSSMSSPSAFGHENTGEEFREQHSSNQTFRSRQKFVGAQADSASLPAPFLDQMVPLKSIKRRKRSADLDDDHDSVTGYCQMSQSDGTDPRVRLCTQCQQTQHMGDDIFPSYKQELVCHPSTESCLNVSGHAHGQCQETRVPVTFLRRNPNRCMRLLLSNGELLLTDDWQLFQMMIRASCQCMVDKRSPFAASVVGS